MANGEEASVFHSEWKLCYIRFEMRLGDVLIVKRCSSL
jgi:hypothetical protein